MLKSMITVGCCNYLLIRDVEEGQITSEFFVWRLARTNTDLIIIVN